MSFLVHPDKNPDDRDRAQTAFDGEYIITAIMSAHSILMTHTHYN